MGGGAVGGAAGAETGAAGVSGSGAMAFVADAALGKLTKWLRCLGVDIEYVKEVRKGRRNRGGSEE